MLWKMYTNLPRSGAGTQEDARTDYYLRSNLINTGVKVREGSHEFKLRSGPDEQLAYGTIEQWTKWSTREEANILNTIPEERLGDWLALDKRRYKKKYEIRDRENVVPAGVDFVEEGCGVEFTVIHVPAYTLTWYTFGFEAFGTRHSSRENLEAALRHLPVDAERLAHLDSFGYPNLLARLVSAAP